MAQRLNEFTKKSFEAVYQATLKDSLLRANVRTEIIDQILEEQLELKHIAGYIDKIVVLPGKHISISLWRPYNPGDTEDFSMDFYDSDFDSDDARQLLREFMSEAHRAQSNNLLFRVYYYVNKKLGLLRVVKIVSYAAYGFACTLSSADEHP